MKAGDKMLSGAKAMVKCLEAEGITKVFGYPGVAIAPFYNGLYDSDIEHILVREEQSQPRMRTVFRSLRLPDR